MKTTEDVLTEVIECFTTAEAGLARAHLGSEGVDATVMADHVGGMYPGVSLGRIRLVVRREDLAAAKRILALE
ncbi:MAG: putative signal transducing protein [Acidimicrobiia bacterium]